ncbi:hypothetical protein GNT69_08080 [Bacillus sp. B15-48]|nr:hypothetical protein [Bacillus sp. B15-48]
MNQNGKDIQEIYDLITKKYEKYGVPTPTPAPM